jgi:uncharacterized protein (UPF0261 family)
MIFRPTVALIGTCDTKLEELCYLRSETVRNAVDVIFIDVGRKPTEHKAITMGQNQLLQGYGDGTDVNGMPRGELRKP